MKFYTNGFPAGLADVQFVFQNDLAVNIGAWSSVSVTESIDTTGTYLVDAVVPVGAFRIAWRVASDTFVKSFEDIETPVDLQPVLDAITAQSGTGFDTTTDSLRKIRESLGAIDTSPIAAALSQLGASKIIVMSPLLSAESASLVRGGDYFISENRALSFTLAGPIIDTLAGRITGVDFIVGTRAFLTVPATVSTVAGGLLVQVELSRADTRKLVSESYKFYLEAILGNLHEIPLASGILKVRSGGE